MCCYWYDDSLLRVLFAVQPSRYQQHTPGTVTNSDLLQDSLQGILQTGACVLATSTRLHGEEPWRHTWRPWCVCVPKIPAWGLQLGSLWFMHCAAITTVVRMSKVSSQGVESREDFVEPVPAGILEVQQYCKSCHSWRTLPVGFIVRVILHR